MLRDKIVPYALVSIAVISIVSVALVQPVINDIEREVQLTSRVIAKLFSVILIPAIEEEQVSELVRGVVEDVHFPIIVVDVNGTPRAWKGVGVDPKLFTPEQLDRPDLLQNDPNFQKLMKAVESLGRQHPPIPMELNGQVVGKIYYGNPAVVRYLRLIPVILTLIGLLTFGGLVWAAKSVQKYQMEALWSMFAKGLAHQMGVPVSSLLGWFELLKSQSVDPEIIAGMEHDLNRIRSILQRFSRVGGGEKFVEINLIELVRNTLDEAKTRFLKGYEPEVEALDTEIKVYGDKELISWALENLVKNAYEARVNTPKIVVRLFKDKNFAVIQVEDKGKGIPKDKQKIIFKKGFTTKERGWGMGLLLTKRIIDDIHKGKVRLVYSEPSKGTLFEIRLPIMPSEDVYEDRHEVK